MLRPRFTLRWLMLLVALVAVAVWGWRMWELRAHYQHLASRHEFYNPHDFHSQEYHVKLRLKYLYAADHPWIPVEPDPE